MRRAVPVHVRESTAKLQPQRLITRQLNRRRMGWVGNVHKLQKACASLPSAVLVVVIIAGAAVPHMHGRFAASAG
jgi:hypothetical protein